MLPYLVGSVAGRIATALCVAVIALPYGLRRKRTASAPYLRRLWPHFWVAYGIAALAVVHVGTVMGAMGRANTAGIWAATVALMLLVLEIALGLTLKEEQTAARGPLRRVHFWVMISFVTALGAHLWWNG